MRQILVDTNVFLRFLLKDIPKQYERSRLLFKRAKEGKIKLFVPQIVIFEVHFALEKYYGFKKKDVIDKLGSLLSSNYFQIDSKEGFLGALELYKTSNTNFVDCFLTSQAKIEDLEIFSFDKRLKKGI